MTHTNSMVTKCFTALALYNPCFKKKLIEAVLKTLSPQGEAKDLADNCWHRALPGKITQHLQNATESMNSNIGKL